MALSAVWEHHYRPTYYWVDALCINQQDIQERNVQVAQMWRIFHEAELVFAWLGPSQPDTELAFTYIYERASVDVWSNHITTYEAKNAYDDLMNRGGYFKRAWIIPEVLQASNLRLFCGAFSCDWKELLRCSARDVLVARVSLHMPSYPGRPKDSFSLVNCLKNFSKTECSDHRDRIFAMLGHPCVKELDKNGIMRPDYSMSLHEVWLAIISWHNQLYPHSSDQCPPQLLAPSFEGCFLDINDESQPSCPGNFRVWLDSHEEWNLSLLPDTIIVANGFRVDCTGSVLSYLLKNSTGPPNGELEHIENLWWERRSKRSS